MKKILFLLAIFTSCMLQGMQLVQSAQATQKESEEDAIALIKVLKASQDKENFGKLKALLQAEADPNSATEEGETPLMWAACTGNIMALEKLITANARVDAVNAQGETALHIAARSDLGYKTIKSLILNGANREKKDRHGSTPLMTACAHGKAESVRIFLETSDQPFQGREREELLNIARRNGHSHIIAEVQFHEYCKTNVDIRRCPTGGCPFSYSVKRRIRTENIQCPTCQARYCTHCCSSHPANKSCVDDEEVAKINILTELSIRSCPKCHIQVLRDDGCDHMTCTKCRHEFCWVDLKPWSQYHPTSDEHITQSRSLAYKLANLRGYYYAPRRNETKDVTAQDLTCMYDEVKSIEQELKALKDRGMSQPSIDDDGEEQVSESAGSVKRAYLEKELAEAKGRLKQLEQAAKLILLVQVGTLKGCENKICSVSDGQYSMINSKACVDPSLPPETPLMAAARYGRGDICKLLLKCGARQHERNSQDKTARDLARSAGYHEVADLFTEVALVEAMRNGQLSEVQELLKTDVKVNDRELCLLIFAVRLQNKALCKLLLKAQTSDRKPRFDINLKQGYSEPTALSVAASEGNTEMVELLLKYKAARYGEPDGPRDTLITDYSKMKNPRALALMIQCGADINALNSGVSLLDKAIDDNNVTLIRLLLEGGAHLHPNSQENSLVRAVKKRDLSVEVCRALVASRHATQDVIKLALASVPVGSTDIWKVLLNAQTFRMKYADELWAAGFAFGIPAVIVASIWALILKR